MDSGFHTRLKECICQRHEDQTKKMSDLREFTLDEEDELEEHRAAMIC